MTRAGPIVFAECCRHNLTADAARRLVAAADRAGVALVERRCLNCCGECFDRPVLLVNGRLLAADTPEAVVSLAVDVAAKAADTSHDPRRPDMTPATQGQRLPLEAMPDVKVLRPKQFGDARGFFSETYGRQRLLDEHNVVLEFVQDNHSLSAEAGTVRGLHYQVQPYAQAKLVRVVRGAILDVAVDLRRRSPTFGRHVAVTVSRDEWNQILVPIGFAHGFCTLEPDTEVIYKVSAPYSPKHEGGVMWNDPALGIDWPVSADRAVLSDKDTKYPTLAALGDVGF